MVDLPLEGTLGCRDPCREDPPPVMALIHPCPQGLPLTSAAPRPGLRGTQPPESVLWAPGSTIPTVDPLLQVGGAPRARLPCVAWH